MIYARVILVLAVVLMLLYYLTMVMHLRGTIVITDRKVSFYKLLIPFYYWVFTEEKKKTKRKQKEKLTKTRSKNGTEESRKG